MANVLITPSAGTINVSSTAFTTNCAVCVSSTGDFVGYTAAAGGTSIIITGSGINSTVRCGVGNTASGNCSASLAGSGNTASGAFSFIGGGQCNSATGLTSTISGGYCNTACGNGGGVVAGTGNTASGIASFVGGGKSNTSSGSYSTIVGGLCNNTCGICNTHIIGSCIRATTCNYTYVNTLCETGGGLSDYRIKSNILDTSFGLNEITKLRPVSWCMTNDNTCTKKYGFIAQDVQNIMSCVVTCSNLHRIKDGEEIISTTEGEPLLMFEKDAIYSSYANAFKELENRIMILENIISRNNLK